MRPAGGLFSTLLRLLGFRLHLGRVLLLLFQIALYVRVWRWCWDFPSLCLGVGGSRQSVLSLFVGQLLQTSIHLYPQLIVHLLQVIDGYCDGSPDGTLILDRKS